MAYDIGTYAFDLERFFPRAIFDRITELRVSSPEAAFEAALARKRRPRLAPAGKLALLAANHPARMITSAAGDPLVMGDRHSYLGRILRVLCVPGWDGVLGTPDILEDLLLVDHMLRRAGCASLLDGRVLIASQNRGGLAGATFEMDDTFTAYTIPAMKRWRLDASMIMARLDLRAEGSLRTLTACGEAISECAEAGLPVFLEALPVHRVDGAYAIDKSPEALIRMLGVASGIGASSLGTWIKIPYTDPYDRVARSTSCPILMLGGESSGDPSPILGNFVTGMASASNVRGALVGRNVHHPGKDDPFAVAAAVRGIVHEGLSLEAALALVSSSRDERIDALSALA